MNDTTESPIQMQSPESWEFSKNYAALFGEIPNSFSTAVRSLNLDQQKHNGVISRGTLFLTRRLMRGRNLKAPFYFAALTFKPEALKDKEFVSDDDLIALFPPDAIAALLGIIYLYKKAKKYCDSTEFEFIYPVMHRELSTAGQIGVALSKVGLSNALLSYGARYIALLTFLKHSPKHFQEYRRALKAQKTFFNLNKEMEYFGCTTPQIASIFIQTLGYGILFSNSYVTAFSNAALLDKTFPDSSPFKVTELWTKALLETGTEPKITHDIKFYPTNQTLLKQLVERAKTSAIPWLDKIGDDISPSLTPQLFAADTNKVEQSSENEAMPEELKETLSQEEISKLDQEQDL